MLSITVTLTQTQFDALGVLPLGSQAWAEEALRNKANSLIEVLVTDYSNKQPKKITDQEKEAIINGIDLAKEKNKRKGKE